MQIKMDLIQIALWSQNISLDKQKKRDTLGSVSRQPSQARVLYTQSLIYANQCNGGKNRVSSGFCGKSIIIVVLLIICTVCWTLSSTLSPRGQQQVSVLLALFSSLWETDTNTHKISFSIKWGGLFRVSLALEGSSRLELV